MGEFLFQAWIFFTGAASMWMMATPGGPDHRRGCWIGLAGQPFWLMSSFKHLQWGIFLLSVFITFSFIRGILIHRFLSSGDAEK